MATHPSTLAWKIPWTEEPGTLQSKGLRRVGHNWATSLSLFTFMHWRRRWQPTPVFLPGESQGQEPGGLLSMGLHRVGHDWRDLAAAAADSSVHGISQARILEWVARIPEKEILLQWIFLTQESNSHLPCILHCRQILYHCCCCCC